MDSQDLKNRLQTKQDTLAFLNSVTTSNEHAETHRQENIEKVSKEIDDLQKQIEALK